MTDAAGYAFLKALQQLLPMVTIIVVEVDAESLALDALLLTTQSSQHMGMQQQYSNIYYKHTYIALYIITITV